MADTEEVERRVWTGAVPLVLELAHDEVSVMVPPEPLLLLAPRMGYLMLLAQPIRDHFSDAVAPVDGRIWFEHEGQPVRWHYPTGVLYDTLSRREDGEPQLPWRLVVHFQHFPQQELISCDSPEACRQVFFNALKEATFLKAGNVASIMSLPLSEHDALWAALVGLSQHEGLGGILGHEVEGLGRSFRHVMSGLGEGIALERVPVKLHLDGSTLLRPQSSSKPDGQPTLIADVLQSIERSDHKCCVQGIPVPTSTALEELYENFCSADQFLHIIVRAG